MPKWVKRPVMIEAVRFTGLDASGRPEFDTFGEPAPRWLLFAVNRRSLYVHRGVLIVATLEGTMVASCYDYICRGVKGELYPCKPDIFEHNHQRLAA